SLGPKAEKIEGQGMAPFFYLPHTFFVAEFGLDFFEASMRAQYELTQRFTAEFSIRPFLQRHTQATLARLKDWANDPSEHVRRLVSEGTRPRLPWAPRLPAFQKDPRPVLALLELLKDDASLYVRRSVANNLNDIGKDHPELLVDVARRWLRGASEERRWVVNHALRFAIKRGDAGALTAIGYGREAKVSIGKVRIAPQRVLIGDKVNISFDLVNTLRANQDVLVDFCIHYLKANGKAREKVFKLKALSLEPRQSVTLRKTVSLAEMTTRKHYPGAHKVDAIVNGTIRPLGQFTLLSA
ncbi:MAG: DNA alkylation repair protein, partial [Burkholderiales bacterium]